jgi:DNA-binding transcriptional MerR regulator
VGPSVRAANGKGSTRRYSFDDLLRLAVVKNLRQAGLSLQRIRKGLKSLRNRSGQADPLLGHVLITDGKNLHRVTNDPQAVEDVLKDGQLVFTLVAIGEVDRELRERVLPGPGQTTGRKSTKARVRKSG